MDSFAYLDTYYMNSEEDYLYIQDHQIYLLYLLEVVYERDVDPTPLGRPLSDTVYSYCLSSKDAEKGPACERGCEPPSWLTKIPHHRH